MRPTAIPRGRLVAGFDQPVIIATMVEPTEAAKPGNLDTLLGSLAGLFMAVSAYLYRKAGKVPRTEAAFEPQWDVLLQKVEEINRKLSEGHDMHVQMDERLIRLERRLESFGRRLSNVEGQQSQGD